MAPYLPFDQSSLNMGLQPLDLDDWIQVDQQLMPYLQAKEQLLLTRYQDVVVSSPESLAAQQEVLQLVLDHLLTYHSHLYQQQNNGIHLLGQTWDPQFFVGAELDLAARLIQEDLCLLQPGSKGYCLTAGSVCFPSHWNLREKWGQPLTLIHEPVADYQAQLAQPVDRLFERLKANRPGYRFNWSLVESPELFLGDPPAPPQSVAFGDPKDLDLESSFWIRVERQTLRRLPQTQGILFTIRTYIYPLSILRQYPNSAQQLADTLRSLSPARLRYKRLDRIWDPLWAWLESIVQTKD